VRTHWGSERTEDGSVVGAPRVRRVQLNWLAQVVQGYESQIASSQPKL